MLDEHALHLGRRHPDPAGLDHVVVAAEERPGVVGRARVDVAGAQPAVGEERRGRGLRPLPVAGGDRRPAHVEVAGRVRRDDLGAGCRRAGGPRSPGPAGRSCRVAGRRGVLDRKMCSASVEPMPSSTGCPKRSLNRRCRSAGSDSPAVTVARTLANAVGRGVGVEQRGDEAGAGEEQRRLLGGDELDDARRRRPARLEDRRRPDRERERQRVAEAVGEEQLGDRQEAVVGCDAEHARRRTCRRSPAGCRGGASRPSAGRSCRSCTARTPASRPSSAPPGAAHGRRTSAHRCTGDGEVVAARR